MQHLGDWSIFGALQVSLGWSRSFLRRGALVPFTANGAHRFVEGVVAIGDAGKAGIVNGSRLTNLLMTINDDPLKV